MNAVISLCNFCELHGPSVLFCTQAFHDMDEVPISCRDESKNGAVPIKKRWYGPNYSNERTANSDTEPNIVIPLKQDFCEGCTSMTAERRGFISNDHEARVSYVSSQYPLHSEVFSIVRQACVRSLSCEVCPGREGPIYYGDDDRGHVLSHTFFLKDCQARGLQSWYSIIIVMNDKIFLLNSWQFLVKHFQKIIHELQEKALKVFTSEQSENNQRSVRLNSVTRMSLDIFRRQRGNVKARSVVKLTQDQNVFSFLHSWFTWILKAGAGRISEKLVEGFPSEDAVVDLENQEEIEEGFIKVHFKKVSSESVVDSSCATTYDTPTNAAMCTTTESTAMCDTTTNTTTCNTSAPETSDSKVQFKNVRQLYRVLGNEKFHCLAYHTVIGNQIIIKSKYLALTNSIMQCLKILLPQGCFHPIYYSENYEDSWKCNFLGILPDVDIPDHVKASELHLQVNAKNKDESKDATSVEDIDFAIESIAKIPKETLQVLFEMERVIADAEFPFAAVDSFIVAQKAVWMNKVKLLFAFSRGKSRTTEETAKLMDVLRATEYDKPILKFWMTGLTSQFKTQILSSVVQQGNT